MYSSFVNNTWYKLEYTIKVVSGTVKISRDGIGDANLAPRSETITGTKEIVRYILYTAATGSNYVAINIDGRNVCEFQIDNVKSSKVISNEAIAATSVFTQIGTDVYYTLATPVITQINYGGLLNSNSNGTLYREKVIADAGVYSDMLSIQLTDYPISSFETIIKRSNGIETILNNATAVIASGGLSFTHPDLQSGDLVLFTYYFANESTEGKTTLTYYDSRYVIADTANGKFYKTSIRSTNGVASIILTEV